jgi:hypothetical protein
MRVSLSALVRLIAFTLLGLSIAAVGLSRAVPRSPVRRHYTAPRFLGVNGSVFMPPMDNNYRLDLETGELRPDGSAPGVSLDYATCSPWTDARGRFDVVGRMTFRTGMAREALCQGSGLARCTEGDRSPRASANLDSLVSGRPCWFPEHPGRVLVPAGNGRVYAVDLATADGDDGTRSPAGDARGVIETGEGDATIRRLVWGCAPPGDSEPLVSDPLCPSSPALRGRVIVSLSPVWDEGGRHRFGPAQLWWLELDPEGTVVVAAGRLTVTDLAGPGEPRGDFEERLANVAATPDGQVVLAYLARRRRESNWRLRVAPLRFDPATGAPRVLASETREPDADVAVTTPGFSTDGRWVFLVKRGTRPGRAVDRRSVSELLAEEPAEQGRGLVAAGDRPPAR